MKRLILILTIFLTLACGSIKEQPGWSVVGTKCVVTEVCRDTVGVEGLEEICKTHNIHSNLDKWTMMTYYNTKSDVLNQYMYICGQDTIYVITEHDDKYIFVMRVNKPIE